MRTQAAAPGSGSNNNTSSSRQVSPSIARRQTPSATTVNGAEELLTQVAPLDAEVSQEELWAGMAWWDSLPSRYKLVLATSFSFVICNMVGATLRRGGAGAQGAPHLSASIDQVAGSLEPPISQPLSGAQPRSQQGRTGGLDAQVASATRALRWGAWPHHPTLRRVEVAVARSGAIRRTRLT